MMKLRMTVLMLVLLLPMASYAMHFTDVEVNANCDGWFFSAGVNWPVPVFEGTISYTFDLMDEGGNPVEQVMVTETIVRESNPQTFFFDGVWSDVLSEGGYSVDFSLELMPGGDLEEGSIGFDCGQVATEQVSWSSIKASYK